MTGYIGEQSSPSLEQTLSATGTLRMFFFQFGISTYYGIPFVCETYTPSELNVIIKRPVQGVFKNQKKQTIEG